MHNAKWSGTVSKFPIKLGGHEGEWDAQQRGFLGLEKVLGSLFADTRHPEKKMEFAGKSQSRPGHELAAAQGRGGVRGPFHQA